MSMLFERFVFVLYVLFSYSWFLLGTVYETPFRFVPIVGMTLSLLIVCIISLFQLQTITRRRELSDSDKWSTIAWSATHIILCMMLCLDGLEWTNVLMIFCAAGIFITLVIATVAMCSCYVIMQNSNDWEAHVHLTCICFWVLVQYMIVRLPSEELQYVTTVPVTLMAMVRLLGYNKCSWQILFEGCLFLAAVALHISCDQGIISTIDFFWGTTLTICLMILLSKHLTELLMVILLPIGALPLMLFMLVQTLQGNSAPLYELKRLYDDMSTEELVLPLDLEIEENWDDKL